MNLAQLIRLAEGMAMVIAFFGAVAANYTEGETARKFRLFMLGAAFWSAAHIYFRTSPTYTVALWAVRGNAMVFMLLPYFFLDFIYTLMGGVGERQKKILKYSPYLFIAILCLTITPLMFGDVKMGFWGWASRRGPLFPVYAINMTGFTLLAFVHIFKRYPTLSRVEKNRLNFFFVSLAVLALSIFTNILLAFGIPFPHGTLGQAAGMLMAIYAILRHRVIDFPYLISVVFARGLQLLIPLTAGVFTTYYLDITGLHQGSFICFLMPFIVAIIAAISSIMFLPVRRLQHMLLSQLDPEKADLYDALESIAGRVAQSRQPERWIEEIERVLGYNGTQFVPFDDKIPHPCPPLAMDHPLRHALSGKHHAISVVSTGRDPCPVFHIIPSISPSESIAVPIYSGGRTLGAMVFGPELNLKLYSSNDVDQLLQLARRMGQRLADERPLEGVARVVSYVNGEPVVLDEELFDSIEDLKSSEFFHFYLPEQDKSIQIIFKKGDSEIRVI